MKIGISGLGRIGRNILRILIENKKLSDFTTLVLSDLADIQTITHLIQYDSIIGSLDKPIQIINQNKFRIDNFEFFFFQKKDKLDFNYPWEKFGVDIVIDATGQYDSSRLLEHKKKGVKVILVTAPADTADVTIVLGVNETIYQPSKHFIISNSSCTTNCLAPLLKVIDTEFGFKQGYMNTIHSFTNDQRIIDNFHSDLRRARSANLSMIPTSTGAAKSIQDILPKLKGKIKGMAIRVPVSNISILDLVFETKVKVSIKQINDQFKKYSEGSMKNILSYTAKPLVSVDYKKNPHSAILDSLCTELVENSHENEGNLVHILAWYNNEWAYSNRVIDLLYYIVKKRK